MYSHEGDGTMSSQGDGTTVLSLLCRAGNENDNRSLSCFLMERNSKYDCFWMLTMRCMVMLLLLLLRRHMLGRRVEGIS